MRSMTGSGQATAENPRHAMAVTLRAVNHRGLDVQVRIDEAYRGNEADLRELFASELARGRVEARVEVRPLTDRPAEVRLNAGVVEAVQAAVRALAERGLVAGELSAGDLLRLPAALEVTVAADEWTAEDRELLLRTARAALAQLVAAREHEGEKLRQVLAAKLAALAERVARLDALRGPALADAKAALDRRLADLLSGAALDPARLAQEAAILADRSDVSEEIDRLGAHLGHFREVAEGEAASGKRLDFLTQEIFRELNTLGAKCRHAEVARTVLDAKVLCEQIREQVQNVE
ncbi:MAG TPA: YicC/YloC family endoribonuclease [Thermoanaerobaculia bacterium]|nr:YicC/YloC family endoribonuclease [Thermoanaerobaculia bacterium]